MKLLSSLLILLCLISCKETVETTVQTNTSKKDTLSVTKKDIDKIKYLDYGIDSKAKNTLDSWQAYNTISNAILDIKKGKFDFFTNDAAIFATTIEDLENSIPENINTASIRARLLVLKTNLFKLEEATNLKTTTKKEHLLIIRDTFQAFSYVTLLINKKFEKEAQNIIKPDFTPTPDTDEEE